MATIFNFLFKISLAILSWIGAFWCMELIANSGFVMVIIYIILMLLCFVIGGLFLASAMDVMNKSIEEDMITEGTIIIGKKSSKRKNK